MGQSSQWGEENSQTFIDYGRYFVPERDHQYWIVCQLIPPISGRFNILELCCGEGLLAGALLANFPDCVVYGLDGSPTMLAKAKSNLSCYGQRFIGEHFDLADLGWRKRNWSPRAVVSSLAIHHLDAAGKQGLYQDVYQMLLPGGVFLIADLIEPTSSSANELAAKEWDRSVRQRALEADGNPEKFDIFQREAWNLYRNPDPDFDKPSPLLDQLKWLEIAGFIAVDVFWLKAGHAIFGGQKTKERVK
jgi:tRNA (cmo5U34)-methyltransferase